MSDLSSFYGGRQGAPFIIVKRFDQIALLSVEPTYKKTYYAYSKEAGHINQIQYPFIERKDSYYYSYNQAEVTLDGRSIQVQNVNTQSSQTIEVEKIEITSMATCFKQGGATTSEVNYGEYVIIDTISKDDPDNGKIFRRGMNYDNDLGGAEYVGQIVGPKGSTARFKVDAYNPSAADNEGNTGTYTQTAGGLLPGANDGENIFNDEIYYSFETLRDNNGNVNDYKIGFKFPYLVQHFTARIRSPYTDGEPIPADEDLISRIDDKSHPFFAKWRIDVPKGIKGDCITELKVFPTIVTKGSTVYPQVNPDTGALSGASIITPQDYDIVVSSYQDNFDKNYVTIEVDSVNYYTRLTNTAELHYGYLQTQYDNYEEGQHEQHDIDKYKVIDHIELSADGWLTVTYTCDAPETVREAIRQVYLDDNDKKGIQINEDGTVIVWYNTLLADGETHQHQTYSTLMSQIKSVKLNKEGHFKVVYNNDNINISDKTGVEDNKAIWETDLTQPTQISLTAEGVLKFLFNNNLLDEIYPNPWQGEGTIDRNEGSYNFILPQITKVNLSEEGLFKVFFNNDKVKNDIIAGGGTQNDEDNAYQTNLVQVKDVDIASDGTITFTYCDNTTYVPENKLKYITDMQIDTGSKEGEGDQCLYVEYNTMSTPGTNDTQIIGNPINYIVESIVSEINNIYNVPDNHLLVYYSDPAFRAKLKADYPSKVYIYKGTKDTISKDGWFDLGRVKGEIGGIHIIGNVADASVLVGETPESFGGSPDFKGQVVTVGNLTDPAAIPEIYAYDYTNEVWYSIGTIASSLMEPSKIIAISPSTVIPSGLNNNGIQLKTKIRVSI